MQKLKKEIRTLIKIMKRLAKNYPPKKFTLDGRLVGDIAETIAKFNYKIVLYDKVEKVYDGVIEGSKKKVQIKSTMKSTISYPKNHHPDFFLALKINESGDFEEIFNGPTKLVEEYLITSKRKGSPNYNFINIGITILQDLNQKIQEKDRIPIRKKTIK